MCAFDEVRPSMVEGLVLFERMVAPAIAIVYESSSR